MRVSHDRPPCNAGAVHHGGRLVGSDAACCAVQRGWRTLEPRPCTRAGGGDVASGIGVSGGGAGQRGGVVGMKLVCVELCSRGCLAVGV